MRPNTAVAVRLASTHSSMSSHRRSVAADGISLVRETFRAWVIGSADDTQLRRAMRSFCDAAHAQNLPPEEVLVVLKSACRSVPEICEARSRDGADTLIARAVTMCIQEFYAVPADVRRGNGVD